MKIRVIGQELTGKLGLVMSVLERKSTIPVLSNILIEPLDGMRLRITGTDLDTTLSTSVKIEEIGEGSEAVCIAGRKFYEIVKSFPAETEIHISKLENEWIEIRAGKAKFKLAGVKGEQFPEIPRPPSNGDTALELPAASLTRLIEMTAFAVTTEQSRFTLSGCQMEVSADKVRMVGTDGHRLSLAEVPREEAGAAGAESFQEIIPKKALVEVARVCDLLQNSAEDEASKRVKIVRDANHVFFEAGDTLLVTRKLSGSFPNYEMVIPQNNDKQLTVSLSRLREVLRRVRLMADNTTQSVKLTVKTDGGGIELAAQSSEEGEAVEQINAVYDGTEEIPIGINSAYLQDYLAQMEQTLPSGQENELVCSFKDGQNQLLLAPKDNSFGWQYILMPLRY